MDRRAFARGVAAVLVIGLGAGAAAAQDVTPVPPLDVFLGAKLGMSKVEFGRLAAMRAKPPRCLRFDLAGPPPARDIQSCDLPADEQGLSRRYLFAPDPGGMTRLISVSIIGHRRTSQAALQSLTGRWGKPSSTTELKDSGGNIHVWTTGAQQLLLRYPCSGKEDLCLEYTDRPFARQATRASTGLLGPPGDRY